MPEILITGFVPFESVSENISQVAVEASSPELPAGWTVRKAILPVSWEDTWPALEKEISINTRIVIAFGHADDIAVIAPERIGVNVRHQKRPDNNGQIPSLKIENKGPAARWTTLPVDDIVNELAAAGIAAEASAHAGTYLCNFTTYKLAQFRDEARPELACGFVHLPPGRTPGPTREQIVEAANRIVVTCCEAYPS